MVKFPSMFFHPFRTASLTITIFGLSSPVHAYQQQLIPIVHQVSASTSATSQWNAFLRVADYGGGAYVSLIQVAALINGHLRWHPVSRSVDLSVAGQNVRFFYDSKRVLLSGRWASLDRATVKNEDGFWVPVSFFATPGFYQATKTRFTWPVPTEKATGSEQPTAGSSVSVPRPPSPGIVHAIHRIVIDPGHGGKDPGAVGPHGTEEKTVNLQLAEDLADALRERGYEVLLTRTDDTFIPLEARARLANKYNADLFISVHCNASLSSHLKGFEVYFLSERASDPHADAVARLENAPLALEGGSAPSPRQVQAVLRSLVKTANINESSALGALVARKVGERLSEPALGVKQAAFYVLRGAEMPSILIETAFLSNPGEEKLLQDASFQRGLIDGILAAVTAYDEKKQKERG